MENDVNGWILTDDDSSQYMKKLGDNLYDCIEVRRMMSSGYAVVRASVDLSALSVDELENFAMPYYPGGLAEVRETYTEAACQTLAECIFEQLLPAGCNLFKVVFSELDAFQIVQLIIRGKTV